MYVCAYCDSSEIVYDAWVSVNTGEIEATFDNTYCFDCDGETSIKEA